ncbi:MAG: hypothetical protein HYW07_20725 [Candidatus Latescibacteria bacterium]|nr:hypothetical protein [Candidatus Latescibacterota bacterium]
MQESIWNRDAAPLWQLAYFEEECFEEAQRALRLPHLSPEWRRPLTQRLRKAGIAVE